MDVYTIDPLNERCRACDRRISLVDEWFPAELSPGIVHVRCVGNEQEPEEDDDV